MQPKLHSQDVTTPNVAIGASLQPCLSPNQRTSISAMISYISHRSGQSEYRLERNLSEHFKVPNPKFLPSNDFDNAIRYLADIMGD